MPAKTPTSRTAPPPPGADIDDAGHDDSLHSLRGLAEQMRAISQQAVAQYTPVVETILRTRSRDVNHIELTLDYLLGFCHSAPVLALFKQLCRYYWTIDPAATASQIHAYREMWDSDESEETSGATETTKP